MPVPAHDFPANCSPSPERNLELKNFFALDDQGNKLPDATCYLYQRGTESQANGLQKANGVAMLNPFSADSNGLIQLAAPNGLYDLRVIGGKRDYRIRVQFNDVSEDLAAANVAADRAETARDAAQVSAGIFSSTAEGLLATTNGKYFSVVSEVSTEYLILFRNTAGVAIEIDRYPNLKAVSEITKLVQDFSTTASETEIQVLTDPEGGVFSKLTNQRLQTVPFDIVSEAGPTSIGDNEGAVTFYADEHQTIVGPLELQRTSQVGIYVTDSEGGLHTDLSELPTPEVSPFEGGLLFSPILVTSELCDSKLYVSGLLPRRAQVKEVSATIASTTTAESQTGEVLNISAARLGSGAVLNVRLLSDPNKRKFIPVALKHVPVQTAPLSPKILFIGDSIGARQGAFLLKQYLEALGLTPIFIGTIQGSASATDIWNGDGPLGECHSGWRSGDFTYSATTSAVIVPPGGEAAYLALNVMARRDRNTFLRAATGADDASVVRNGYVFDPAFYQSRFGLDTPDIVINALGTNDAYLVPLADIYSEVLNNDKLIHKQIKAAWPSAKIIRTLPTNALSADRNVLWETQDTQVIKAMQAAAVAVANSRLTIAPLWAMTNPEGGYAFNQVNADSDGFYSGTWTDGTHPIGAARSELYRAMAPYVAAAALNLI